MSSLVGTCQIDGLDFGVKVKDSVLNLKQAGDKKDKPQETKEQKTSKQKNEIKNSQDQESVKAEFKTGESEQKAKQKRKKPKKKPKNKTNNSEELTKEEEKEFKKPATFIKSQSINKASSEKTRRKE